MPSIELVFDSDADAAVRAEWALLHDAGLPGQADHTGETNAPHLTAAYCTGDLDPFEVQPPAGRLVLGSPMLFRRRRGVVLVRQVVLTRELIDWHAQLHTRIADEFDVDPRTRPDAWTPHVTLALSMPLDSLPAALTALGSLDDIPAHCAGARMWNGRTRTLTDLTRPAS